MDTSRRAVESYWRSRLIDGVTSPEDKVAPVYKLEEVCDLLRSSHVGVVKEVSEFILNRLDHKSPIVKQKALRVIKYCVGKSGVEFRRDMQRHSAAVRQLSHYKGQPDQLKGDSLNKAVRDTASEALTAIFASDEGRPSSSAEVVNKRIQGFGSTNYEMPLENKKSFLSEVVNLGNASIRQGLSTISSAHSLNKNDNGSYKSPNLCRSLTREADRGYDKEVDTRETWSSIGNSRSSMVGATNNLESRSSTPEANGDTGPSHTVGKSREERLLDTIVTSGGVRLQPTRDTLQMFLTEAMKVDAGALQQALEAKLQSPLWQVRMKAICVLEAILRKKEDVHLSVIATYFSENPQTIMQCSETPQVTLREKANKVLALLHGEGKQIKPKAEVIVMEMPDLIDTGDADDDPASSKADGNVGVTPNVVSPLVDDLFGDTFTVRAGSSEKKNEVDPFADVSFHTAVDHIFSGLNVDGAQDGAQSVPDLFTGFNIDVNQKTASTMNNLAFEDQILELSGSQLVTSQATADLNNMVAGLSLNESSQKHKFEGDWTNGYHGNTLAGLHESKQAIPDQILSDQTNVESFSSNVLPPNLLFSSGSSVPLNIPPNLMFNPPSFSPSYTAMSTLYGQQQLLAAMSNLQHVGRVAANTGHGTGSATGIEGSSSPLPDIFHFINNPVHTPTSVSNSMTREDTRAFDFISEHLLGARDSKKVS